MRIIHAYSIMYLMLFPAVSYCQQQCGILFGDPLFIQRNNKPVDYDTIIQFPLQNYYRYKLSDVNAVAIMVLLEKGYTMAAYQQFKWSLPRAEKIWGAKSSYSRILVSHVSVKKIDSYDVRAGLNGLEVRLFFRNGGSSLYYGKDNLYKGAADVTYNISDCKLFFSANFDPGTVINRRIYSLYLCSETELDMIKVKKDIEQGMDSLKLDLTYVIPRFLPVVKPDSLNQGVHHP
jgi:hypothetical protein